MLATTRLDLNVQSRVLAERVLLDEWSPDTTDADASASAAASSDTPPAGELYKPTRDAIRDICTAQSFQRGVSYYEDGRVGELTLDGSDVTATVRGSAEYRVTADLSVKGFGGWCSCPYDYAGDCKHIVAVLPVTARESRPSREEGAFRHSLSEPSDEQGGRESRTLR